MRILIVFVTMLNLLSPSANAAGPSCMVRQTLDSVANAIASFQDVTDYVWGGADSCWTDPRTGASTLTCDEVAKADKAAFMSHFDYNVDPGASAEENYKRGFRNCSPIEAPKILEELNLSDIAKATDDSLACALPLINEVAKTPRSPRSIKLQNQAWAAFQKTSTQLGSDLRESEPLRANLTRAANLCATDMGVSAGGVNAAFCVQWFGSNAAASKKRLAELDLRIHANEQSIPLGRDQGVRSAIESMAKKGSISAAEFRSKFSAPVRSLAKDLSAFQAELTSAKTKDGRYALSPSLQRRLMQMENYDDLVKAKANLSPKVKNILTCLHDRRKIGNNRFNVGLMGGSALTALVTAGTSAELTIGAKATLAALNLGFGSVSAADSFARIYDGCYQNTTAVTNGKTCSAEESFNLITQKTSNSSCAMNILTGAAPALLIGAGAGTKLIVARAANANAEAVAAAVASDRRLLSAADEPALLAMESAGRGSTLKAATISKDEVRMTHIITKMNEIKTTPLTSTRWSKLEKLNDEAIAIAERKLKQQGIQYKIVEDRKPPVIGDDVGGASFIFNDDKSLSRTHAFTSKRIVIVRSNSNPPLINHLIDKYGAELTIAPQFKSYEPRMYSAVLPVPGKPRLMLPIEKVLSGEAVLNRVLLHEVRHLDHIKKMTSGVDLPYYIEFKANAGEKLHDPRAYSDFLSMDELSTWDRDLSYETAKAFHGRTDRRIVSGQLLQESDDRREIVAASLQHYAKTSETGIESAQTQLARAPQTIEFKISDDPMKPSTAMIPFVRDGKIVGTTKVTLVKLKTSNEAQASQLLADYLERAKETAVFHRARAEKVLAESKRPPPKLPVHENDPYIGVDVIYETGN